MSPYFFKEMITIKHCENNLICFIYCLIRVFISTLFKILMTLMILFVVVTGYKTIDPLNQNFKTQDFLGYELLGIGSNSMYPGIKVGDGVLIKLIKDDTDINKGDVIAYNLNDIKVVHRVIGVDGEDSYITKGDNNDTDDSNPIPRQRVIGKKVAILPKVDRILDTLRTPVGIAIFAVFTFSIFTFLEYLLKIPDIYFKYEQEEGGEE